MLRVLTREGIRPKRKSPYGSSSLLKVQPTDTWDLSAPRNFVAVPMCLLIDMHASLESGTQWIQHASDGCYGTDQVLSLPSSCWQHSVSLLLEPNPFGLPQHQLSRRSRPVLPGPRPSLRTRTRLRLPRLTLCLIPSSFTQKLWSLSSLTGRALDLLLDLCLGPPSLFTSL